MPTADSIERSAQELLRRANALAIPVDLNKVANSLNVKIHEEKFDDQAAGVLIVKGEQRHVLVNASDPRVRQRFTIAHEIGHLTLHEAEGDLLHVDTHIRVYQRVGESTADAYKQDTSPTTPEMERDANLFAAALLMPASLLQHAALEHDLWDEVDVAALAKAFQVSEQAMSIRLQQLDVMKLA